MNSQEKARQTYLRITSHAPYSEMNGIPREWFEKKIEEALDEQVAAVKKSGYIISKRKLSVGMWLMFIIGIITGIILS